METYIDKDYAVTANTICSYFGKSHLEKVTVPSRIVLIDIHALGAGAYYGNGDIKEVVIPACIQTIGKQCFAGCHNLTRVVLEGAPCSFEESVFYADTALRSIVFPRLTLTSSEYGLLKDNAVKIDETTFAVSKSPYQLLPHLFPAHIGNYSFAVSFPNGIGSLFQTQDYRLLPSHSELSKEKEHLIFLSHLENGADEVLSLSAEKENDDWIKTEQEHLPTRVAVLTFDDTGTTFFNGSYTVNAEIRIGYFYWQSAKRVRCDKQEYFIYRRHFLTDMETCEYIRQDAAVYTRGRLVESEPEAKKVYEKYRMLSYI